MTNDHRRTFLVRIITALWAAVSSTLAVLVGGAVLSPSLAQRGEAWVPAGAIDDLDMDAPTAVTVRVSRPDGYMQVAERQVVLLVKTGDDQVRALSTVCTHLGCRVSWDARARLIKCPCHGGVYDALGQVKGGPPPKPLATVATRIEGETIFVQL